jgi:hypothetical protein
VAKYTNTRTGATRESSSKLGYPYVETAKIERANKAKAGKDAGNADNKDAGSSTSSDAS